MLKYPLSTLLYLAKINIKDTIKDALKLHNNIDISLTAIIKDKDGKVIKVHKQRSHSFVANFLAMIGTALFTTYGSFTYVYYVQSTNGNWSDADDGSTTGNTFLPMLDSANDSSYGIVVGTGTATPTPQDYKLGNQIVNGTGSGQLVYNAHTYSPPGSTSFIYNQSAKPTSAVLTPSGNITSIQVSRTFQNQSGASITVSEVGIISKFLTYQNTIIYVLIIHDLLSSSVTIPNNAVLTIVYTISVTT